jgi:CRISPR-associated endonuclease/helicase Cas3
LVDAERAQADDLALHLIAAHHGWARPGFPDSRHWGVELLPEHALAAARRTAERFSRLQERYGPWQLAWLEALLKAADAWVSAGRDRERGDAVAD